MFDIIAKKRDGGELSGREIDFFVTEYVSGRVKDYQAAAFLMATYINGLSREETAYLTMSMAKSGDVMDLSTIPGIKVDKHSTGGVGDKTTLVVLPVVAALGVPVAKMSGRALGHTGGTIDKLMAIPGVNTDICTERFLNIVKKVGCCVASQSGNLVPADKKLYALRDVTATIGNMQLIASSVMSKKIACGADGVVLDVKTGDGAFMETLEESLELAEEMVSIGKRAGKKTVALVTNMDTPLGVAVGNSLEIMGVCEILKGRGDENLANLSVAIAAEMLVLAQKGDLQQCCKQAQVAIKDGSAFAKLKEMVNEMGGDASVLDDYGKFKPARVKYQVKAKNCGTINRLSAQKCGMASVLLGAGRETKNSAVDYSAGIFLNKQLGASVKSGETIATFYSSSEDKCRKAEKIFEAGVEISPQAAPRSPLILARVSSHGVEKYV